MGRWILASVELLLFS